VELEAPAVSPDASLVLPSTFAGIGSNVVSAAKTDTFSSTSGTYADVTGLSVTITPTSATSKILLIAQVNISTSGGAGDGTWLAFTGGNAGTYIGDAASTRQRAVGGVQHDSSTFYVHAENYPVPMVYLDSPATTSATTYKVQMAVSLGTGYVNQTGIANDAIRFGRTASSITAIEVAA